MPLTYDLSRTVVIAASSPGRFVEECEKYNIDPTAPALHVIYTPADLAYVRGLGLPYGTTPWCTVGPLAFDVERALTISLGAQQTFAAAMDVREDDVLWPRSLTDKI